MSLAIQFTINPNLFLRDPLETKLGKRIIKHGIELMDEIGLESFTFKKLATAMGSTEASIYRYFENKHLFLTYLLSWYWEWVKFRIDFNSMNVTDPQERLKIVIKTIVDTIRLSTPAEYIDRDALHRIVVIEGPKAYHNKHVDTENRKGYFATYKSLTKKIADIILEIDPKFPYPRTHASNLVEMANNYLYFAEHLPGLTDISISPEKKDCMGDLENLLEYFILGIFKKK